jgi:hypothetical protein
MGMGSVVVPQPDRQGQTVWSVFKKLFRKLPFHAHGSTFDKERYCFKFFATKGFPHIALNQSQALWLHLRMELVPLPV